jgi:NAD(P)-dependent dehydrogenase (short-subunit alcohol dehydrogenase family)
MVDHASMTAAAQKTSEITGGVVDYLIVNGGYVSNTTAFLKPTEFIGQEKLWHDELTQSMATNTEGVLYSINAFIGLVKKSSIKKVIVISTGFAAFEAMAEGKVDLAVPYSLSKVAVNMLVQRYAAELEGEGVIFLALSPGMVLVQAESMEEGMLFLYRFSNGYIDEFLAPPEVQWALGELTKKFQTLYPDFKGPILPEESIEAMLKVVDGLTIEQSGQFLSHYGNQTWL